jgi:hypothetical protein
VIGNGAVVPRKITTTETINYVSGQYKWNSNSQLLNINVNTLKEYIDLMEVYRMVKVTGMQIIFTKRFAIDIPLSGVDQKMLSALCFNIYPDYVSGGTAFVHGDSTKIVPVTMFGTRTYNILFRNVFELSQWKRSVITNELTIQIAPLKQINIQDEVDIPVFDVMIHINVLFSQPI